MTHMYCGLQTGAGAYAVNSRVTDPVAAIRKITAGGAEYTLECSGRAAVLRQAIDSLGVPGTSGMVRATPEGTEASFNVNDVMIPGCRIVGIVQGDVVPHTSSRADRAVAPRPLPVRPAGQAL